EWHRDRIVTARVLKVDQHPNADKLKLVTLEYGAAEPKVVVTGAPNLKVGDAGQVVVLALTGSVLFDGHATPKKLMELKPTQLRGVPSDAMVCSGYELGTTEDHEGIILLPEGTPAGRPLADLMGDVVLEVDILPNMARCLALLGVAREVSAITGAAVRVPAETAPAGGPAIAGRVEVSIADPELSNRYIAYLIEGVNIRESPLDLQTRLNYAGMRPINNVVDATNFVMLEQGQPLHAFDYDVLVKRAGGKTPHIVVRPAKPGEILVTLDKAERKLTADHLVIADAVGPIALAGVMGGLETEVTSATKNILLEAAHFDFVSIRRTAKAFDLPSEASYRFSRGLHPATAQSAGRRAAQMIAELSGGKVAAGEVDCYPARRPPQVIDLPLAEVRRLLGIDIPKAEATRVLKALDFQVDSAGDAVLRVTAPTHRVDIQDGPADLIEELARIGGYDRLPATLLADPLPAQLGNAELAAEEEVRDRLVGYGLQEFITYSLTTPAREAALAPPAGKYVHLVNPIISDRDCLRHTVLAGVLECVAANLKHVATVRAFEIGPVFLARPEDTLPDERTRLAIALTGPRSPADWSGPAGSDLDFFDLKGIVEGLVRDLHLENTAIRVAQAAHLHPGKSAQLVVGDVVIGTFGELHPKAAAAFELARKTVLVGEFDLTGLLGARAARFAYSPLAKYPAALRDVAVIVPEATPAETVAAEVRAGGAGLLSGVQLFDVYRGDSIPAGTKSLAFALSYQAADRTLTDKEVDKAHQKIEARLKHVLKASIRGKE
ncbi:MAG: phenylalanine--tRNA ligase subunit beta, partial [Gemmataceae bacterium]|nr:phenylalanine--tRNA ligase subunit beta [Gemmataceae bacterium]